MILIKRVFCLFTFFKQFGPYRHWNGYFGSPKKQTCHMDNDVLVYSLLVYIHKYLNSDTKITYLTDL